MKPSLWWRAQHGCVDHPKLIKLSDRAHRNWFNLNCVASANGGVLPDIGTVAIKLRLTEARAAAAITELVDAKLFDLTEDGYVPHDWSQWQFKTDGLDPTNTERQRKHRALRRAELAELKALRNSAHNASGNGVRNAVTEPVTNTVTAVTTKRPETETDITTTVSVERGPGNKAADKPPFPISPSLAANIARKIKA
jgi:hypothetical protein